MMMNVMMVMWKTVSHDYDDDDDDECYDGDMKKIVSHDDVDDDDECYDGDVINS